LIADVADVTFPVGPKGTVHVRIVRPKDNKRLLPVIMYFHGGGWVLGDVNTHDRLIREIAVGARAAVVFVDYDRAASKQCAEFCPAISARLSYPASAGRASGRAPP
jgi:acetyl esterase